MNTVDFLYVLNQEIMFECLSIVGGVACLNTFPQLLVQSEHSHPQFISSTPNS